MTTPRVFRVCNGVVETGVTLRGRNPTPAARGQSSSYRLRSIACLWHEIKLAGRRRASTNLFERKAYRTGLQRGIRWSRTNGRFAFRDCCPSYSNAITWNVWAVQVHGVWHHRLVHQFDIDALPLAQHQRCDLGPGPRQPHRPPDPAKVASQVHPANDVNCVRADLRWRPDTVPQ